MAELYVKLDANFPDDEKVMAAGLDGAGLYAQSLCIAKRMLTDGVLTRSHLHRLGASDDLIERCVTVGLYENVRNGSGAESVRITAWLDRNPSAETVLTASKGTELNHRRWHVKGRRPNPDCEWCKSEKALVTPDGSVTESVAESVDGIPETETETETETSSLVVSPTGRDTAPHPPDDDPTISPAALRVATARAVRLGRTNPTTAWLQTVARQLDGPHLEALIDAGHASRDIDLILDGRPTGSIASEMYGPNHTAANHPNPGSHYATLEAERQTWDTQQDPPADPAQAAAAAAAAKAQLKTPGG